MRERKYIAKKLVSFMSAMAVLSGMFVNIPAAHAASGATADVVSLNFEDKVKLPTFNVDGTSYATTAKRDNLMRVEDGAYGKFADNSLRVNVTSLTNDGAYLYIPEISRLKDFGGGSMVVSWDMATTTNTLASARAYIELYKKKRSLFSTSYATQRMIFYTENGNKHLQTNSGASNSYRNLGKLESEKWHRYDLVLYYDTQHIQLYEDGNLLYDYNDSSTVGSGYKIVGVGDGTNIAFFGMADKNEGNATDQMTFFDNIRIKTYNSDETFSPTVQNDFSNVSDGELTAKGETITANESVFGVRNGVFGKASTDKSLKLEKAENVTTGEKDSCFKTNSYGSSFKSGGKIHFGISIATDKVERNMKKYINIKSSSSSAPYELVMTYGKLTSKGANDVSADVAWESGKWYKFDVYITPGSSSAKSKATVYLNGRKVIDEHEINIQAFAKADNVTIGQKESYITSDGHQYSGTLYIDDIYFNYYPSGITPPYREVKLSSKDEQIKIVDNNTIFVDSDVNAEAVKVGIVANGADAYVVSDSLTEAANKSNASDCYLLVRASDDIRYIYPIVERIVRYSEEFSEYAYTDGSVIKDWTASGDGGLTTGAYGLGGKNYDDQSFVFNNGTTELGTKTYQSITYATENEPVTVEDTVIVEFSMLSNDPYATDNVNLGLQYINNSSNISKTAMQNFVSLGGGIIGIIQDGGEEILNQYKYDTWNRFSIVIDTSAFSANLYLNGRLIKADIPIDGSGSAISGIYGLNVEHKSENQAEEGYSAIDDIEIYIGKYQASIIDEEVDTGSVIKVSELNNNNLVGANTYIPNPDFWDMSNGVDVSLMSGEMTIADKGEVKTRYFDFDELFMVDTQIKVSEGNGYAELSMHDYLSAYSEHNVVIARIYKDKVVYMPDAENVSENTGENNITLVINPQNREMYIYNNGDFKLSTTGISDSIDFSCVNMALSAKSGSSAVCSEFVIGTDSIKESETEFSVFAPQFIHCSADSIKADAIILNKSGLEKSADFVVAMYEGDVLKKTVHERKKMGVNGIAKMSAAETTESLSNPEFVMFLWESDTIKPITDRTLCQLPIKTYTAPSVPTIEEIKTSLNTSHPRLLVTDFTSLAEKIQSNTIYKSWFNTVKSTAETALKASLPKYDDTDEMRILSTTNFQERLMVMAFAYNITGETTYAERIWQYIRTTAEWPDWGYQHFIDTADLMMGYAFAYDWLYSYWTDEQKAFIRNTLVERGLEYTYKSFTGEENDYWVTYEGNWIPWVDSGVITAALAVADEESEIAIPIIRCALENLRTCYFNFEPDGAWAEGTGYGEKAMSCLAIILSACETALSSDFGHRFAKGLDQNGFYTLYMYGMNQEFRLGDNGGDNNIYYNFYFGKLFNDKYINGYRYYQLQTLKTSTPTMYDIIWYDSKNLSTKFRTEMPYDKYYTSIETATMKNGFFKEATAFAGLHAGYNNVGHGHIDGGTFEYETNGIRWAMDLGNDNYNLFNYFQTHETTEKNRWGYYRCRAEGHNTWVINPDEKADQKVEGEGEIVSTSFDNTTSSYAVADLTDFYSYHVKSAKRGIMLNKADGSLIVRDEIKLKNSSELYWFMHTEASVTLSGDKKSAVLTQKDSSGKERRLWVGITEGDGVLEVMDAKPLPSSPDPDTWYNNINNSGDSNNPKTQNSNEGVRKLSVHFENAQNNVNQTVYMKELATGESAPSSLPQNVVLSDWEN